MEVGKWGSGMGNNANTQSKQTPIVEQEEQQSSKAAITKMSRMNKNKSRLYVDTEYDFDKKGNGDSPNSAFKAEFSSVASDMIPLLPGNQGEDEGYTSQFVTGRSKARRDFLRERSFRTMAIDKLSRIYQRWMADVSVLDQLSESEVETLLNRINDDYNRRKRTGLTRINENN